MELESYKIRPDSISLKVKAGGKDFNPKLFLFTEQGLEEIEFINGKPKYPSVIYREESKVAYGINFHDINSDGFEDWIYSVPTSKKSVRLRLGSKDGFGPERSFDYPLSSFNPIPGFDYKKQFVGINKISKQVSVFAFTNEAEKTNTNSFQQLDFDLFPEGESDTGWIFSDFNKDGKKEILATSPLPLSFTSCLKVMIIVLGVQKIPNTYGNQFFEPFSNRSKFKYWSFNFK